jgi:hypothetical protein
MHSREQIARDIRIVNGSAEGERVVGYLLSFCHVFSGSMAADCNPNMTLFNEGQRSVGNEIVALLVNEPDRLKVDTLRKVAGQAEGKSL